MKVFIVLALTLIWTKMSMAKDLICTREADIIFVLDTSEDGGSDFFKKQQSFASHVSNGFGADTRFGAVSTEPLKLFDLDTYSTKQDISQALESAQYTAGDSNTHLGLKLAQDMMTKARPNATKVVTVLVGWHSINPPLTKQAAINLKNTNVRIIGVLVNDYIESVLVDVVPNSIFWVDGYETIQSLGDYFIDWVNDRVIEETCKAAGGNPPPQSPPCPNGEVVGSQCFTFNSQRMTQADAAASCAANGGEILAVKTEKMYIQLGNFSKTEGVKLWAGAEKAAEGGWRWISDKSPANIQKKWFQCGEPNNRRGNEECLQMQPNGKLNDASCCKRFAFVCVT